MKKIIIKVFYYILLILLVIALYFFSLNTLEHNFSINQKWEAAVAVFSLLGTLLTAATVFTGATAFFNYSAFVKEFNEAKQKLVMLEKDIQDYRSVLVSIEEKEKLMSQVLKDKKMELLIEKLIETPSNFTGDDLESLSIYLNAYRLKPIQIDMAELEVKEHYLQGNFNEKGELSFNTQKEIVLNYFKFIEKCYEAIKFNSNYTHYYVNSLCKLILDLSDENKYLHLCKDEEIRAIYSSLKEKFSKMKTLPVQVFWGKDFIVQRVEHLFKIQEGNQNEI